MAPRKRIHLPNAVRSGPPRKREKVSRIRVLLWVIELTVLAAAVEHFLITPMLRPGPEDLPPVILPASARPPGRPVPPLEGETAPLAELREVSDALLPSVEGLAPGSALAQEAQLSAAAELSLPVEVVNPVGMHFRLVPAGTFLQGSPEGEPHRWEGETQHPSVIHRPFYMGRHEVTQAQWRAVVGTAPSHFRGDLRPVEEVTWYDCQRFVNALCELEGADRGTYRLPTEAEWEYACRAGTTAAYCFGGDAGRLGDFADFELNNHEMTNEVGRRWPNAYGLHDMHGNVWEWCLDRFRSYTGADDLGLADEQWRSLRGGNWRDPAENCRSANRCRLPPASHGNLLGLRVVREIGTSAPRAPPAP